MPRPIRSTVANGDEGKVYMIERGGQQVRANVLERHGDRVYVHYEENDKRMDEWRAAIELIEPNMNGTTSPNGGRKRKRGVSNSKSTPPRASPERPNGSGPLNHELPMPQIQEPLAREEVELTEEELDLREHRKITAKRNFDKVNFGQWQIKTWYFSPYPLSNSEEEDMAATAASNKLPPTKIHNVSRTSMRAHGRTSDIFASGLMRGTASGEKAILWVCDRCFKYMREGMALELHSKSCHAINPPGRKVYQRGGHIIWEVDGAKEKLYCQNLSLFGKLFIDIKTLFFDCENFLFYVLTEYDSQRDHVIGFFSKEKVSYDDYNLACIVVLPPYQRRRYGMLMIEFSYELSRRAGKIGTPERPLSDLGLRSYLTYWIATLIRFFRRLLSVRPAIDTNAADTDRIEDELICLVNPDVVNQSKRRKSAAWENGAEHDQHNPDVIAMTSGGNDAVFHEMRHLRTTANPDGSATTHVFVKCTLEDISVATGIRTEDVAFALHEVGLLQRRRVLGSDDVKEREVIVFSREMVEAVAKTRGVKKMCLEVKFVLDID